jgi:uracil-DNA glycosylase family 4
MTDNWQDEFDVEFTCPICGSTDVVPPSGDPNSPYLIIGVSPGKDEVKEHAPMVGKTGGVLGAELRKLGRDKSEFRITNLWHHPPSENKKDENYEKCFNYGAEQAIKEAVGRKAVLLIGAETTKYLTGLSVETHTGLQVQSQYLSAPTFVCIQPTNVYKGGVGEFRESLKKWIRQLERIENEQ